jgi:hypothetical protein
LDRRAVVTFCDQLREARENALRDAEAFDGLIHAVERLGSFLHGQIANLGRYKPELERAVSCSALARQIPERHGNLHIPFSLLYELVRHARNDALHQGAFARRLTGHAIELSLILEDALRSSLDSPVVSDYMVRNPVCAELWQPISFIRQQMLANSFSFLPVNTTRGWSLISDIGIATYLGANTSIRKDRLAQTLTEAGVTFQLAKLCAEDTSLEEALRMLDGNQWPLLVHASGNPEIVVGIITPFDLL